MDRAPGGLRVAYDANAPLNGEARALLAATPLDAFLASRCSSGQPSKVVVLDADDTVAFAMDTLARHAISSAPVLSSDSSTTAPFYGFVDVPTIVDAFYKGDYLSTPRYARSDRPGAHQPAPPPRYTQTSVSLGAYPTPLREDLVEPAPATGMLGRMEMLNSLGPKFAQMLLRHVSPGRDGELLFRAALRHSLLDTITSGFLRPPRAGVEACHRLAVFEFASVGASDASDPCAPAPVTVTHVISQTDVIRWTLKQADAGRLGVLPRATLGSIGAAPKHVVCVTTDETALDAYAAMLSAGLPAAGVLNAPVQHGGVLVGALLLDDLRTVSADTLGCLALPVGALKHNVVWSSAAHRPSTTDGPSPPSRRDVLMQRAALVALRPTDTLGEALHLLVAKKARAVFIVDDASHPLGILTPTDVLRLLAEESGRRVGDVSLAPT